MNKQEKLDKAEITHLIGTVEEKAHLYVQWDCPERILMEAANRLGSSSYSNDKLFFALSSNFASTKEIISILSQKSESYGDLLKNKLKSHVNHPNGQHSFAESIMIRSGYQNRLLSLFKDDNLYSIIKEQTYVSGNSLSSILADPFSRFHDFDFYFKNRIAVESFLKYMLNLLKISLSFSVTENEVKIDCSPLFFIKRTFKAGEAEETILLTKNAVTFISSNKDLLPLQFIFRRFGPAEKVVSTFDFCHTKMIHDLATLNTIVPPRTGFYADYRILVYDGGTNPIGSLFRSLKFLKRGMNWRSMSEYMKICYDISKLDLSNKDTLIESISLPYEQSQSRELIKKIQQHKGEKITFQDLNEMIEEMCHINSQEKLEIIEDPPF